MTGCEEVVVLEEDNNHVDVAVYAQVVIVADVDVDVDG